MEIPFFSKSRKSYKSRKNGISAYPVELCAESVHAVYVDITADHDGHDVSAGGTEGHVVDGVGQRAYVKQQLTRVDVEEP